MRHDLQQTISFESTILQEGLFHAAKCLYQVLGLQEI